MLKLNASSVLLSISLVLGLVAYVLVGYFIPRHETLVWLCCWGMLSVAYGYWMIHLDSLPVKVFVTASVVFRLVFTFSLPALSDDYYRFLWDGMVWETGSNPFSMTPRAFLEQTNDVRFQELFPMVYGKNYNSVYPPLAQLGFWLAAKISVSWLSFVIVLRLFIFLFEAGTMVLLFRILEVLRLPSRRVLIYALNPLIVIEFSGNLHHEAYVVFFLVLAIWWLIRQKTHFAAVSFSGAVLSKLLPLLFLPSLVRLFSKKGLVVFVSVVMVISVPSILIMTDVVFLRGLFSGLSLYYEKFEFNPSLWFVVRAVGYEVAGYNIIGVAGPVLWLLAGVIILFLSLRVGQGTRNQMRIPDLANRWAMVLSVYLFFSTTVHPWYVAPLVLFSVLGTFTYPLLWSCLIMLTYAGYTSTGYVEVPFVLLIEYLPVLILLIWEWRNQVAPKS